MSESKKKEKKEPKGTEVKAKTRVAITAPNLPIVYFRIIGTSPLVINKFSAKAREEIMETQRKGSTAKKGKKMEPKDFDECFRQAQHISEEGWQGIHAGAFRSAMVSACRLCGYAMTLAKLSVFAEKDGLDADEATPLVRIIGDEPEKHVGHVRNASGVADIRCRPMWRKWEVSLGVKYDADQFTLSDVTNLLARVGVQVGVGEGRHDSKKSCGMGWGCFRIATAEELEERKAA